MNTEFHEIIKEICKENNIKIDILSEGWIIVLQKKSKKKFIVGHKFDINNHALGKILDDKYGTYEILKLSDVPVCEHSIAYSQVNKNAYAIKYNTLNYYIEIFNKYKQDIVIKENTGTCGKNVNRIKSIEELKEYYDNNKSEKSLSICPFYKIINEYRVIVLNNKVELIYKKELPKVIGNGKSTIKQLLEEFNYQYFKNINSIELNKILKKDEEYAYNWKFNLSQGAKANFKIDKTEKNNLMKIINKIVKNLELGFCSVDIIKTTDNEYRVLEINSGIMTNNLIKENINCAKNIKKIYTKAIRQMFK